jgi:hypothetical protein
MKRICVSLAKNRMNFSHYFVSCPSANLNAYIYSLPKLSNGQLSQWVPDTSYNFISTTPFLVQNGTGPNQTVIFIPADYMVCSFGMKRNALMIRLV